MRLAACVLGVAWLVAAWPGPAQADDAGPSAFRAVIDRVDVEPAVIGGLRLRIGLSTLALQGQVLDVAPGAIKATLGGSKLDAPYALGRYDATDPDTAIVFAIQANQAFADVLPNVLAALDDNVLAKLNDRTLIAVLGYGETTATEKKLVSLKAGRNKLTQVASDGSTAEPALIDTLDGAMRLLKRAKTAPEGLPLRKMIVVISDGRERSGDRDRITSLGQRADREGVRIHTFGFAASKVLRPLLTLGELSRQSRGTFRWVRTGGAESWGPAFLQLHDEIARQHVLTYFLPSDTDVAGKKLKIEVTSLASATSEAKVGAAHCGTDPCATGYCAAGVCAVPRAPPSRGVLGWLGWLIGIALIGVVVLGVIGFVLQLRQRRQQPPLPGQPGVPGVPPGSKPPKPAKASKPPRGSQPPAPAAPAAPTGPPWLLFMTGPRTGERVALVHGFLIGKAPTSHLVIDDGYTSSVHAQVIMDQAGNCRLYDHASTNGTFANGVRVTDIGLSHGMLIRVGSTELRFLAQ